MRSFKSDLDQGHLPDLPEQHARPRFSLAELQLGSKLDEVSKKAEQARERARELAAQRSPAPTATPPATVVVLEVSAAQTCRACKVVAAEDDAFCGNCGHKLM